MDEYISVSDLENVFSEVYGKESPIAKGWIDWVKTKAKKADVEPVRHGHWEKVVGGVHFPFRCSRCKERTDSNEYLYCHCGAKMGTTEGE